MSVAHPNWELVMIIFFLASLSATFVLVLTVMSRFYKPHQSDIESGIYANALGEYASKSPSFADE